MEQAACAGLPAHARRAFDLTVDEAIERALDRNLGIVVERVNPPLQDLTVAASRSRQRREHPQSAGGLFLIVSKSSVRISRMSVCMSSSRR